jgi:cytochrome bd-type quinol oxidase subunit 2
MGQPAPPVRGPVRGPVRRPATWAAVAVLLTVAIIGTLWVPLYARSRPELGPFPFFYWYQLIWVPLTAVILWICYLLLRTRPTPGAGPRRGGGTRK